MRKLDGIMSVNGYYRMPREEAEKIIRKVTSSHVGEPMEESRFRSSVDQLLNDVNGEKNASTYEIKDQEKH